MNKAHATAAVIVLVLILGACGGGETSRAVSADVSTKQEFIAAIDAICATTADRYEDIEAPGADADANQAATWLDELIALNDEQYEQMEAVPAPEGAAAMKTSLLQAVARIRDAYQDALLAARANDARGYMDALGEVEREKMKMVPKLRQFRFTTCAGE